MAITDSSPVTLTAACELGSHKCRGVVLSLTGASWDAQTPCTCDCHGIIPDQDEDLDRVADEVAEIELERSLEAAHGWWS